MNGQQYRLDDSAIAKLEKKRKAIEERTGMKLSQPKFSRIILSPQLHKINVNLNIFQNVKKKRKH